MLVSCDVFHKSGKFQTSADRFEFYTQIKGKQQDVRESEASVEIPLQPL